MSINSSINMDARYLRDLVSNLRRVLGYDVPEIEARLLRIADNIDKREEKLNNGYAKGFQDGQASVYSRSNVATSSHPVSPNLYQALQDFKGEVKKLDPTGPKKSMQHTLTLEDLDLEEDLDL